MIMPFSETSENHNQEYWNDFYKIIQKIVIKYGYNCSRSEVGPYKIFTNIVNNIEKSDIVIAVLTDYNANVWYELGIRHTLKTGTIMLLQEGQKIPFDINDFGIIIYKDSIRIEDILDREIKNYLDKLTDDIYDSPVIYSLNGKSNINLDKKLDEMKELIWRIINEIPKDVINKKESKFRQNRILWVDDYPINNEIVIDLLEERGITFDIALTTKQGLDLYRNKLYDMVITDMGRGKESNAGIKLIKELRDMHCNIPIIVYASERAIQIFGEEALRLGAYQVTHGISNIISIITTILEL